MDKYIVGIRKGIDSVIFSCIIEAFMFIPDIAFDVIKHFDNIIPGVILIVVNALFIAK